MPIVEKGYMQLMHDAYEANADFLSDLIVNIASKQGL